ncbi:DUF6059 family protein [Streptomyces sp. NPDC089919]|uniref:DUF6059 family protein n=1 Tax=Streptomyces sp. NPDC089919 TaxID=3155188 RepID=UPI00342CD541
MSGFDPRRLVRALWEGLVVLGRLHVTGGREEHEAAPARRRPVYDCPPAGHPERLRPEVPLSPVERRLSRHLREALARSGETA